MVVGSWSSAAWREAWCRLKTEFQALYSHKNRHGTDYDFGISPRAAIGIILMLTPQSSAILATGPGYFDEMSPAHALRGRSPVFVAQGTGLLWGAFWEQSWGEGQEKAGKTGSPRAEVEARTPLQCTALQHPQRGGLCTIRLPHASGQGPVCTLSLHGTALSRSSRVTSHVTRLDVYTAHVE